MVEMRGFYRLSLSERRRLLLELGSLSEADLLALAGDGGPSAEEADKMVENGVGVLRVPLGLCLHLGLDGRERVVPMAVEEASVIAAASHAAKLLATGGGIISRADPPRMVGQIQLLDVPDLDGASATILARQASLLARANAVDPVLCELGGGAVALSCRRLEALPEGDPLGPMLIVELEVDVRDAMGANAVNSMCEALAPVLAKLSGGRALLKIVTNLADRRRVWVEGRVAVAALAPGVAANIEAASIFAERDPYRAATHNKGIMNGIDAVVLACGQDWRAVEAGAHAFAARSGRYGPLARWRVRDGWLVGQMELPMAVGVVGGIAKVHPGVRAALKLADVQGAEDLARLVAAVGLAQNLAALRALSDEGIQRGHMRLHARNLAVEVGAVGQEVDTVAAAMADSGSVRRDEAARLLAELRRELTRKS